MRSRLCWRALSLLVCGAQRITNLIERIYLASPVSQRVLLDARAYLIEIVATELDYTKGVKHAGGVLELIINSFLLSLEGGLMS